MVSVGFGLNGLQAWIIQRISAVIITLYVCLLIGLYFYLPTHNIGAWQKILSTVTMRGLSFLTLLALIVHSWLGLWIVITDYFKQPWLSLSAQFFVCLALLFYLVWGIQILWQ